jgi:exonuclease VII small subunit
MSSKDSVTRNRKGAAPEWNEMEMRARTRRLVFAGIGAIIGLWVFLIGWIVFVAPIEEAIARPLEAGADLTMVLAPVLAASLGVERVLETVFNMIEGAWRTGVAYLGYGMRWLKSAETEVAEARQWLQSIGAIYNGNLATNNQQMTQIFNEHKQKMVAVLEQTANDTPGADMKAAMQEAARQMNALPAEQLAKMTELLVMPIDLPLPPEVEQKIAAVRAALVQQIDQLRAQIVAKSEAAEALLKDAQSRLTVAENKLSDATSSADYRSAKSAVTIVLGLMLGVIIAAVGQIQAFALLGIGAVPARFDVLITGLVIGSGSYPVHSLVGILQQSKDALDGLGNFLDTRAAPSVQAMQQTITTVQPGRPGQPPTVGQSVIQTTSAQSSEPAAGG